MPRVSEAHKAEVRQRLLDAAQVCLERNGYRDITTRELLAEAGLSNGTLYTYFPTKDHLYEALAEDLLDADRMRLTAEAEAGVGMATSLLRFVREVILATPEMAVAVATFRSRPGADAGAALARINARVVEGFRPLVERSQTEGTVRADIDAAALVELLDVVWDGLGRRAAQGTFATSYERVGDALLDLLVRGGVAGTGGALEGAGEERHRGRGE